MGRKAAMMQVKARMRAADLLTRTTKRKRKVAAVTMLVKTRMKAADLSTRTMKRKRKVAVVAMLAKIRMRAADLSTRTMKRKRKENQKTTVITKEEMKREMKKKSPRT